MEKLFVKYEEALALKELGFDQTTFGHCFTNTGEFQFRHMQYDYCFNTDAPKNTFWEELISAPTFSQAFRWFREKYNISYSIDWMSRSSEFYNGYYVHFRGINGNKLNQENFIGLNDELPLTHKGYGVYKTYEEAESACLKKLIEICQK